MVGVTRTSPTWAAAVTALTVAAVTSATSAMPAAYLPRTAGAAAAFGQQPFLTAVGGAPPPCAPLLAVPAPPAGAVADGEGGWAMPRQPVDGRTGRGGAAAPVTGGARRWLAAVGARPGGGGADAPPTPVAAPAAPATPPPLVTPVPLAAPPPPAAVPQPPLVAPATAPVAPADAGAPFVPPPGCPRFPPFNLFTVGATTLVASEVLGPLACGGDATLTGFSVNPSSPCDPSSVALAVGGALNASSGQVANGGLSLPAGVVLPDSVGRVCAAAVPAGAFDFAAAAASATAASAALCGRAAPAGCVTSLTDGGGVSFDVSAAPAGALALCTVPGAALTAATGVTVAGRRDASTVVAINVLGGAGGGDGGGRVRLAGCESFNFVPPTTVLNFCGVAALTVDNVGVPAAVLAPGVALDGPAGNVRGSVVVASVDTGVEFRNAPFAC
ncbi:hypothetical protein BU14_0404s0008 [Porphyra umbilicalis]|uniref:Choice-of-anchor A domain-containing protein n=1 Tax=Porphyra umbilicalis TaxID=2786 RepID=A0A1X6NVZ1_PORUM|nr:hypothetical protein BU14_0404s0008 [Porphyra umbilicalis]|eukprot:OSX72781.1 hypothetical protein BU14_0404s0008 [Porphyra umbilicalis]